MRFRVFLPVALFGVFFLSGCNSYITRTLWQSIGHIADPVPPSPDTVKTPMLENPALAVSWAGHSTVLIQIRNRLFITDPLFTNTIGMLVKRNIAAGLDPSTLPSLDYALVSHVHFDHLSYASLDALPKNATLLFPAGIVRYIPSFGFKAYAGLSPWESTGSDSVRITAVPVQHFGGRYGFDRDWYGDDTYTGYVIEYRGIVVFFAGDTGYDPELFKEIGRRFKVDCAIVPIAPSAAEGLGSRVHVSPDGALAICRDVGARYMVPIHYETFLFGSTASPRAPLHRLLQDAGKEGMRDRMVPLEIGEQRVLISK